MRLHDDLFHNFNRNEESANMNCFDLICFIEFDEAIESNEFYI